MDPMSLKKIQGAGFMPFKDRLEASLAFSRPHPKPVPLSTEAQRISRMNLELLEDNVAADEKIASLESQIEQGRVVLANKHARVYTLKGQLDSSRTQCASLESQLCEQTKLADGYKARIGDLETELGDAHTTISALEAEVHDKEADIEVLRKLKDKMYADETELLTALRDGFWEFEAAREDHALKIAGMKGRLIEMKDSKEQVEKALEEESARLAEVQAELDDTKERLQVEKDKVKELRDLNEAAVAEIAELKWSLEGKDYELAQAMEKIAGLESSLKNTEVKLSDAERTILKDRDEFALAKDAHDAVQALLTDQCSDLTISLEHANHELADVESKLEVAEGQLIDIEEFVSVQEIEIQQKDKEIARLQRQAADDEDRAKADIEVRDAEISELHKEVGGMQMELEETRNGWRQETEDLKERLGGTEGELQGLRDEFGAFKEATQVKEVALEGRIVTLENEVRIKDAELGLAYDKVNELEDNITNLVAEANAKDSAIRNTIVATLLIARSAEEQRQAGLARQIALERKVEELTKELRERDNELEVTRTRLEASDNQVIELDIQLADKDQELHEASGWSDDLDALIEDKDSIIRESRDEINHLKAHILELESQLTASAPPPIPLALDVTTIVPLDIDDTPSSDIVPTCNLPQDADYFARIAPEATYESSHTGVEAGPDLLVPHSAKILLTRPQRRGVYKVRTPYSTTRLGVRGNIIVSTHDLVTGEIINLGEGTQPAQAPEPPVPTPGPQLSAAAPTLPPNFGQSSVQPPQLCPSAPSFIPRPSPVVESPQLRPNVPLFTPCQPPLRVTQLRASVGGFAPRPQLGGPPFVNVPWSPFTPSFIPRQPSPVPPFIPAKIPTPIMPLHFAPYPSPFPPFVRPVAPFVPTYTYANNSNNMYGTPPARDNHHGAVRTDTDVRAGEAGVFSPVDTQMGHQGPTDPSPLAQSITELSIASIPSTDRVARVYEDVTISTKKSFPNLRLKDPIVVERIGAKSSCLFN